MSTTTTKQAIPTLPSKRMTVDEFERLDSYDDNQLELIDGYVVRREEMKPAHVLATKSLRRLLEPVLPIGWFLREDKPIRIPDFNEPLPDVAAVRGDYKAYAHRHPSPADVALLIEVSDKSLRDDRRVKRPNYGKAGIPSYWIVNLVDRQVEVHAVRTRTGYKRPRVYRPGDSVPVMIDGDEVGLIAVSDILP